MYLALEVLIKYSNLAILKLQILFNLQFGYDFLYIKLCWSIIFNEQVILSPKLFINISAIEL